MVVVFATVYTGMILGELPRLALDRTGVPLLGAIRAARGRCDPLHSPRQRAV